MKVVNQPKGSRCCGQACVATLIGIPLEESQELFKGLGKSWKGPTNWPDLRDVLWSYYHGDVSMNLKRVTKLSDLPKIAVLVVK